MARPYLTPDEYWRDPGSFWIHRDPITGYPTMNSQNQFVYGRSEYPQAWVSETDLASPGTPAPPFAEPTPIPSTNYAPPSGAGYGAGFDQTYPEGLVGSTVDMPGTPVDPFANPSPIPAMPGYGSGYVNAGGGFDPAPWYGIPTIAPSGVGVPGGSGFFDQAMTPPPAFQAAGNLPEFTQGIPGGSSFFDTMMTPPSPSYDSVGMGTIGFPSGSGLLNPFQEYSLGGGLPTDYSSLGVLGSSDYGGYSPDFSGFADPFSSFSVVPQIYDSAPTSSYSYFPSGAGLETPPTGIPPNVQMGSPGSPSDFGGTGTVGQTQVEVPTDPSSPGSTTDNPFADPSWLPPEPVSTPDQPVTPDGTQLPDSGIGSGSGGGDSGASDAPISVPPGYTPAGFPIGYTPFAGGVGPAFSPGLGIQSLSSFYGGPLTPGGSMSMPGMPGTFVSTPSGEVYSTAVGMFGLGAMNAPGGSFSLGMGGPESGISIRTQGDAPDFAFGKAANEAAKLGMSVDDYMAMMDSAAAGPTKFQTNALADPYKFWQSRILQSRRMAAAGSGSQPSGPIGIDPTYSIDAARNAGMYKGWTFDPAAGTFVPPSTAKPSKGANK